MSMLFTSEIRWFIKGEIPVQVQDWFMKYDTASNKMPVRTDYYLRLPGDGIGIKIREGLLEHKQRSGGHGEGERWSDGENSGIIERWEKLSFPVDNSNAIQEALSTYRESWIGVEKKRKMRILQLDDKGNIFPTTYEKVIGTACGWELTELSIEGREEKWWTMGFEAFGNNNDLQETLVSICQHILKESPVILKAPDSLSYPEWLSSF